MAFFSVFAAKCHVFLHLNLDSISLKTETAGGYRKIDAAEGGGEYEVVDEKKVTVTDDGGHDNRGADIEMTDIKVKVDETDTEVIEKKAPVTAGHTVDVRTRAMKERPDEPADEEVRRSIIYFNLPGWNSTNSVNEMPTCSFRVL
jgi:hypothetical protein